MKTKIVIEYSDNGNAQYANVKFGRKKYLFLSNVAKSIYNRIKSEVECNDIISKHFNKKKE